MKEIQTKQIGLDLMNINVNEFEYIVQYLDLNRTIRFKVGDVLQKVLQKQSEYREKSKHLFWKLHHYFGVIDQIFSSFSNSFTQENYAKMVQLIKHDNIIFFSMLYSSILNQSIILTNQELSQQKKGLIQLGPNILSSFQSMKINQTIPEIVIDSTILKTNPLQLGFNGQKNKLFKAMTQFVECLIKINQAKLTSKDYKNYKQLQNYLKNIRIEVPKNKDIYKNKIYYTQKKMLDILNKNTISLVFKFLPVEDILKLRLLNKWFCHQLPSFIQSSMTSMSNNIETLKNQLNQTDPILVDLIIKNMNLRITRNHICEVNAMRSPPQPIQEIVNLFVQVTPLNENVQTGYNAFMKFRIYNNTTASLIMNQESIHNDHYYIQYSEEDIQKIELFLSNISYERMSHMSYGMLRMYLSIQINYFLTKLNISKIQYYALIKLISQINSNPKLILRYQQIHQKLISKQVQQQN